MSDTFDTIESISGKIIGSLKAIKNNVNQFANDNIDNLKFVNKDYLNNSEYEMLKNLKKDGVNYDLD